MEKAGYTEPAGWEGEQKWAGSSCRILGLHIALENQGLTYFLPLFHAFAF